MEKVAPFVVNNLQIKQVLFIVQDFNSFTIFKVQMNFIRIFKMIILYFFNYMFIEVFRVSKNLNFKQKFIFKVDKFMELIYILICTLVQKHVFMTILVIIIKVKYESVVYYY